MSSTIEVHRIIAAPPERVYRAFIEPEAMVKWLPPHGFVANVHHLEARVGGSFRMSFTNFSTKNRNAFEGIYLDLNPNELIRYTNRFDDPNLPGEMRVTIALRKVICGTELRVTQEGIPEVIPREMCYMGWHQSFVLMAQLVEPEITDG